MVITKEFITKLMVSHLFKKAVRAYANQEVEHMMATGQNTTAAQQTIAISH